jgi:hypothetical protein
VIGVLSLAACNEDQSGATREQRQTQMNQNQASTIVGMPGIVNFTEKRNLKMIYELRDQESLVTYTYYLDLNGGKHKVCPTTSVGYPFPYSTQYTAPKALRHGWAVWPNGQQSSAGMDWEADQPEPNGLYMPQSAEGSWVICLNPDGKTLNPIYVEPRVIASPFALKAVD